MNGARTDLPVKSAVDALKLKPKPVGPIAFAEFILGRHESGVEPILLNPEQKHLLKNLDAWVMKATTSQS